MPAWNAWKQASDVPAGSYVHAQLELMRALVRGEIPPRDFDDRWWPLRSAAINAGQEPRSFLGHVLQLTSAAAEDYVADPDLRDPEDLDDQGLITAVVHALAMLADG